MNTSGWGDPNSNVSSLQYAFVIVDGASNASVAGMAGERLCVAMLRMTTDVVFIVCLYVFV